MSVAAWAYALDQILAMMLVDDDGGEGLSPLKLDWENKLRDIRIDNRVEKEGPIRPWLRKGPYLSSLGSSVHLSQS